MRTLSGAVWRQELRALRVEVVCWKKTQPFPKLRAKPNSLILVSQLRKAESATPAASRRSPLTRDLLCPRDPGIKGLRTKLRVFAGMLQEGRHFHHLRITLQADTQRCLVLPHPIPFSSFAAWSPRQATPERRLLHPAGESRHSCVSHPEDGSFALEWARQRVHELGGSVPDRDAADATHPPAPSAPHRGCPPPPPPPPWCTTHWPPRRLPEHVPAPSASTGVLSMTGHRLRRAI